jgi:hypothetical protein
MRNYDVLLVVVLVAACGPSQTFYPSGVDTAGGHTPGSDAGDSDGGLSEDDAGTGVERDGGAKQDAGSTGSDGGRTDIDSGAEFNAPPKCTSGGFWTKGDTGSADMHPGMSCRKCHVIGASGGKKTFDIGGTLYPSAHEPDECNGIGSASVVITDANGATHTLSVNAVGNFYNNDLFGFAAIPKPYTAKVVVGGKTREMVTPQTDGDCNVCHSQQGSQTAPGRLIVPL